MPGVPTGTVTFLFTDIEGSSKLWERTPDPMKAAVARHDLLMREVIERNGGYVFKTVGDAFCAAFSKASDALAAAIAAQHALNDAREGSGLLRVRIAVHTGAAEERDGDYFGPPLNRVARLLIGHGGQTLLSQATYELVRDVLLEGASLRDLGLHRLKDLSRPEHVFQVLYPGLPTDFPPLKSLDTQPNNLPQQLTSFIGREREMAEVKRLLSTTRLLTLMGAGGCGKTRLALQVAADLLEDYTDGVWFVDLAPLFEPTLLAQAIATALGVREEPGCPLGDTLTAYLARKNLLLVLDNCEHLVAACAQLSDSLLRACANLRILATSREGLGIGGETTWRLPSLASPDPEHLPSLERLTQYEAVRLFIDRAVAALPTFITTSQNAPAVAQVCHRLDGIPLAIELAAARVKVLSVEQINTRLEDRFRLLTGGSRTALPRQQTLRAAVDWGYELLSEKEQKLWQRLSVFAGGWTLEAAEAVCVGEGMEESEVLDLLAQLVDKSLVLVEETSPEGVRYRLLATLRQYGRERLAEGGNAENARRKHAQFFLAFAEKAEEQSSGPEQAIWLKRLEAEHDNVRAVLEWALARDAEIGLRLSGVMGDFWSTRGYLREGLKWLGGTLALPKSIERTAERAKALCATGNLTQMQGDYTLARPLLEESLSMARELGNRKEIANCLITLGWSAHMQDNENVAQAFYEEGIEICRRLNDKQGVAACLKGLGDVAYRKGNHESAYQLFEESLAINRQLGNEGGIGNCLNSLAIVAHHKGNNQAARALYEESLAIARKRGFKKGEAVVAENLASMARERAEYDLCRSMYEKSLAIHRDLGSRDGVSRCLAQLGRIADIQGNYALAESALEESLASARELGSKYIIAQSLFRLGVLGHNKGSYLLARSKFEESLNLARELGDKDGIAACLRNLGNITAEQGDYAGGRSTLEESLSLAKESGNKWGMALGLAALGKAAYRQSDYKSARALYAGSLSLQRELDSKLGIADLIKDMAKLAEVQGEMEGAACLLGATEALRESLGAPLPPVAKPEYDQTVAAVRAALGEETFQAAWAQGRAMTLEQAIAYALEEGT